VRKAGGKTLFDDDALAGLKGREAVKTRAQKTTFTTIE
jgi:hypothetical protein